MGRPPGLVAQDPQGLWGLIPWTLMGVEETSFLEETSHLSLEWLFL